MYSKGACNSHPRRWLRRDSRRQLTRKNLGELKKPLPKNNLATRARNLSSPAMKTVSKSPGFSKTWRGSGTFPAEISTTAKPNTVSAPLPPATPFLPPSAPVQRRLQGPPAKSKFLAVACGAPRSEFFLSAPKNGINKRGLISPRHSSNFKYNENLYRKQPPFTPSDPSDGAQKRFTQKQIPSTTPARVRFSSYSSLRKNTPPESWRRPRKA
jgi:hypothetical protein